MANPTIHHRLINQQILQLPHNQDGSINYTVLGNMLTATILGETLEVSFVDREYGKPSDQLLKDPETNWEFHYKENDVIVFRKKRPQAKSHCFLGRGVVEAPMSKVVEYIHKFHSRLEWDDFLIQIEICKCISENDWLYYMAHEAAQCLYTSRRDFFLYCRTGYVDNKYVQTSLSIEHKDYPHRKPYIRGEIMEGSGWVLEKYKGSECSTLVSYVVNMDLKELPATVMNRVLKRQPMAIHHMRKKLTSQSVEIFDNPKPSDDKASNTTESEDGSDSMLQYNDDQPVIFEDTIPINHYMNRDTEKSTEINSSSSMYPWVNDKRALKLQKKKKGERISIIDKQDSMDSTNKAKPRTKSLSSVDNKCTMEGNEDMVNSIASISTARSISPVAADNSSDEDEVLPEQLDLKSNDEQSRKNFPSFSDWAKQ